MASEKWKEASIRTIKVSQTLIAQTENDLDDAIRTDPLPSLRDRCVRETNRKIHNYARSVRAVVVKLRHSLVAVNDEMKCMNRTKESLYRSLNATRRLLAINNQSVYTRQERPIREKKLPDAADESLQIERTHLMNHKQQTEDQLHTVLSTLQVLNRLRANISSILQERTRVTDLLCHSVGSSQRYVSSCNSTEGSNNGHVKSFSAPTTSNKLLSPELPNTSSNGENSGITIAVQNAVLDACNAISDSQRIRNSSALLIDELTRQQTSLRDTVNDHIVQRIAQTATLMQHLSINNGEARVTLQASQKHLFDQERSLGHSLGPISSRDITVREKLDRPVVRVYQRHPGTDLPEAAHLLNTSNRLTDSINITQRNIALLKLARRKMKDDTRDKRTGIDIDSNILRMRKREGDKRMLLLGTAIALRESP